MKINPKILYPLGSAWRADTLTYPMQGVTQSVPAPSLLPFEGNWPFTGDRSEFGVIQSPTPATLVNSSVNQATVTKDQEFTIPAGSGNAYWSRISDHFDVSELAEGERVGFLLEIDPGSGTFNAPTVKESSTTLVTLTDQGDGLWAGEFTVGSTPPANLIFEIESTDASNPITGNWLGYAVAGAERSADAVAVQRWIDSGKLEGNGNIWPREFQQFSVNAGDGVEAIRAWGVTIGEDEEVFVMIELKDVDGDAGIPDRIYITPNTQVQPITGGKSTSQNIFIPAVKSSPGLFAGWLKADLLGGASGYTEFVVDNAQSIAGAYTQKQIDVETVNLYKTLPTTFSAPAVVAAREWSNDGKIIFENYEGLQDVSMPVFADTGTDYVTWQSRRYDKTGDGYGGGVGSVLEELLWARRTDNTVIQPIYQLTDVGLNEFAMKADGWGDFQGGNVHGGQARTTSPILKVDGTTIADPDARASFGAVDQVQWIEQTQIADRLTPSTIVANLTATKTWEGRTFTLKNELEFLVEIDMLVAYMFMFSPYVNVANNGGIGAIIDSYTLPDQSGATYTPDSGVKAAYPAEQHFRGTGAALGLQWDIEVLDTPDSDFRSWIQAAGSSRKIYMSPLGIRDSFGLVAERTARTMTIGETLTLETRMTLGKV